MKATWYTHGDNESFRREVTNDVQQLRHTLANVSSNGVTADDVYRCIGIESFLSQDLMRRTMANKRNHMDSVLAELRSHRGGIDHHRIRQVSENSSMWSRERAHLVACETAKHMG